MYNQMTDLLNARGKLWNSGLDETALFVCNLAKRNYLRNALGLMYHQLTVLIKSDRYVLRVQRLRRRMQEVSLFPLPLLFHQKGQRRG